MNVSFSIDNHPSNPNILMAVKKVSTYFNAVLSCIFYTTCSVSMVLINKYISSEFSPEVRDRLPQLSIIVFQCLVAVVLVEFARFFQWVQYPSFDFQTARAWLPVNLIFIGMLCSGFASLLYVNVPMVTIFKNLTNLVTVSGDWYLFNERVGLLTILSIVIMTTGAALSAANDLEFSLKGYIWMMINCLFTSSYVLYMKFASSNIDLPKFGMVFYNNFLTVLILTPLCILNDEVKAWSDPEIMTPNFIFLNLLAGFVGFYLNFASLWCVGSTSATTYAIVGSLNKVPITVLGFVLFQAKMTERGFIFVTLATIGGFLYAYSKLPTSHNNSNNLSIKSIPSEVKLINGSGSSSSISNSDKC